MNNWNSALGIATRCDKARARAEKLRAEADRLDEKADELEAQFNETMREVEARTDAATAKIRVGKIAA